MLLRKRVLILSVLPLGASLPEKQLSRLFWFHLRLFVLSLSLSEKFPFHISRVGKACLPGNTALSPSSHFYMMLFCLSDCLLFFRIFTGQKWIPFSWLRF